VVGILFLIILVSLVVIIIVRIIVRIIILRIIVGIIIIFERWLRFVDFGIEGSRDG
jgi:hypothetical protein